MSRYLLIESRDPFESGEVPYFYDLAGGLAREGHEVTLFLVKNGVLPARPSARAPLLTSLAREGVRVLADDFSLAERGISEAALAEGVAGAPIDRVVELLAAAETRALWH
ncbi:MAG: DsrE family protein [Thermoanaerobaculia bacterium]